MSFWIEKNNLYNVIDIDILTNLPTLQPFSTVRKKKNGNSGINYSDPPKEAINPEPGMNQKPPPNTRIVLNWTVEGFLDVRVSTEREINSLIVVDDET